MQLIVLLVILTQNLLDSILDFGILAPKVMDWQGENNYVCPPICLIPCVLLHMANCKALGTIVIPFRYTAPFWPTICDKDNSFKQFFVNCMDLPPRKNAFILVNVATFFGSQDFKFRMLALELDFDL